MIAHCPSIIRLHEMNEIAKRNRQIRICILFALGSNVDWITQPEQAIEQWTVNTFGFVNYDDSLNVYISCFQTVLPLNRKSLAHSKWSIQWIRINLNLQLVQFLILICLRLRIYSLFFLQRNFLPFSLAIEKSPSSL